MKALIIDYHKNKVGSAFEHVRKNIKTIEFLEATTKLSALNKTKTFNPDIIVLHVSMRCLSNLDLIPLITSIAPNTPIIVYSTCSRLSLVKKAIHMGANGYVLKSNLFCELTQILESTTKETFHMCNELVKSIISSNGFNHSVVFSYICDNRAIIESILYGLSKGITADEIALLLDIDIKYIDKIIQVIVCNSSVEKSILYAT